MCVCVERKKSVEKLVDGGEYICVGRGEGSADLQIIADASPEGGGVCLGALTTSVMPACTSPRPGDEGKGRET